MSIERQVSVLAPTFVALAVGHAGSALQPNTRG